MVSTPRLLGTSAATALALLSMVPRQCLATTTRRPNVAVFGSGAVGLLYGGRLLEGGNANVNFLCRRDYERLTSNGFEIRSKDGNYSFGRRGSTTSTSSSNHIFHNTAASLRQAAGDLDYVICSLKSHSLRDAVPTIKELVTPGRTRIIALMNGYGIESDLRSWINDDAISLFGAMAFVCANRQSVFSSADEPVVINHLAYGAVVVGHLGDSQLELRRVKELWRGSRVDEAISTASCLRAERWRKLCWNIPYNGLSVANGGITTEVICRDPYLREYADRIMQEVVELANLDLAASGSSERLDGPATRAKLWHLTDHMGPYRTSAAIDLVSGREMEMKYLFGNVLERARYFERERSRSFSFLVSVLLQVHAIGNLAQLYRLRDRQWSAVDPDFSAAPGM